MASRFRKLSENYLTEAILSSIDIVLLIVFVAGCSKGYSNGLIVEVFSIVSLFMGLLLSFRLAVPLTAYFFGSSHFFDLLTGLVFLVSFLILTILFKVASRLIKKAIDITFMGKIDNVLGAIFGIVKWGFVVSLVIGFFSMVGVDLRNGSASDSVILPYMIAIGLTLFDWVGEFVPFIRAFLDSFDYIYTLDRTIIT